MKTRRLLGPSNDWATLSAQFEWEIPEYFNIAEACCDSWAAEEPDRIALIHLAADGTEKQFSYGKLAQHSNQLANAFAAHGVGVGDRCAILLAQSPETILTHFATYKLGAITLPLFTLFGEDGLLYRLKDSGAKLVVTDRAGAAKIRNISAELPDLEVVFCVDGPDAEALDFWGEIDHHKPTFDAVNTLAEDPALIIYTSGTTGPPKGTLHAHRFLLGHLPTMELSHDGFPQEGDVGWTPADWAWIGGLMDMAIPCLYYGVPLISHRMAKFEATAAYDLMARFKVRNLFMPPTALKLLREVEVPEGVNIRSIASGGESLGADLLEWGRDALGVQINEIYGQTECNLSLSGSATRFDTPAGAIGRAVPGFEVAIIDAQGNELPRGELGEIAVATPNPVIFLRYWNLPEKTAEKFVGRWLKTGDLGRMDEAGNVTFATRDDDVITSAGYRIGPTEIEHCLAGHPDVVMAAAVGIPDALRTEVVKAFVVLREGAVWAGLEDELIQRVRHRISPHVAPRMIERIDAMPMTATGKIMRRALRDGTTA